jgi:hypothetical protein
MTGIVSLRALLVTIVAAGIVGLVLRRIFSLMNRPLIRRMPSHGTSRSYCIPQLTPEEVERGVTIYVPITYLGDAGQIDDIVAARRVPLGR